MPHGILPPSLNERERHYITGLDASRAKAIPRGCHFHLNRPARTVARRFHRATLPAIVAPPMAETSKRIAVSVWARPPLDGSPLPAMGFGLGPRAPRSGSNVDLGGDAGSGVDGTAMAKFHSLAVEVRTSIWTVPSGSSFRPETQGSGSATPASPVQWDTSRPFLNTSIVYWLWPSGINEGSSRKAMTSGSTAVAAGALIDTC